MSTPTRSTWTQPTWPAGWVRGSRASWPCTTGASPPTWPSSRPWPPMPAWCSWRTRRRPTAPATGTATWGRGAWRACSASPQRRTSRPARGGWSSPATATWPGACACSATTARHRPTSTRCWAVTGACPRCRRPWAGPRRPSSAPSSPASARWRPSSIGTSIRWPACRRRWCEATGTTCTCSTRSRWTPRTRRGGTP